MGAASRVLSKRAWDILGLACSSLGSGMGFSSGFPTARSGLEASAGRSRGIRAPSAAPRHGGHASSSSGAAPLWRPLSTLPSAGGGTRPQALDRHVAGAAASAGAPPALEQQQRRQHSALAEPEAAAESGRGPAPEGLAPSSSAAAAAGGEVSVVIQGTVQKVHFRSLETAYTVLRLTLTGGEEPAAEATKGGKKKRPAKPRRESVTVVGTLPQVHGVEVAVGQAVRFTGQWTEHAQYGRQLRAEDMAEVSPTTVGELEAYLAGGVIPGVGPSTAERMVAKWGEEIVEKLDSDRAAAYLRECAGIGTRMAQRIKEGWDLNKGTRQGVMFLREHGIPVALAQRAADLHGPLTKERVEADPYAALAQFGLSLARVDLLAARVGAHPGLASRGALALSQALAGATAEEGHTFLPWALLAKRAEALLEDAARQHGRAWEHPHDLALVAQHMHVTGALVAEPDPTHPDPATPSPGGSSESSSSEGSSSSSAAAAAASGGGAGAGEAAPTRAALRALLLGRLPALTEAQADALLGTLGGEVLSALDAPRADALRALCRCPRIGPKTAEKLKLSWDAGRSCGAAAAAQAAAGGLTVAELAARPPALGFPWGPATRCFSPRMHSAEVAVAEAVAAKAALFRPTPRARAARIRSWIEANQEGLGVELSEGQRAAIESASDSPLMVLTGGPGCGKTTVVQTIVKLWAAQGKLVHTAAPTGRAAQRMGVIQGVSPCTLHRLLQFKPRSARDSGADPALAPGPDPEAEASGGAFLHSRHNPLDAAAVLVDEASMLSLPLAAALLSALRPGCQLVLVGDVDQLPPVGPGTVLHSIINSGLARVVDLREIFRQDAQSAIITSALSVRRGELPMLAPAAPTAEGLAAAASDAVRVAAPSLAALPATVLATVDALLAAPDSPGAEHLQVLSPMRKGAAGTIALNRLLQALLNPPAPAKPELPRTSYVRGGGKGEGGVLRLGDRVMAVANDYEKEVFNGEQGTVCAVSGGGVSVRFPHLADSVDGDTREYVGVELSSLELAYAVTVHKAQGGEAAAVVLALSPQHGRMLSRRLLYTGLTRARERLVVVSAAGEGGYGQEAGDPLAVAVRRGDGDVGDARRNTALGERLAERGAALGLHPHPTLTFSNEDEVLGPGPRGAQLAAAPAEALPAPPAAPLQREDGGGGAALSSASSSGDEGYGSGDADALWDANQARMAALGVAPDACEALAAGSTLASSAVLPPTDVQANLALAEAFCGRALPRERLLLAVPALLVTPTQRLQRSINFAASNLGAGAQHAEKAQQADGPAELAVAEGLSPIDQLMRLRVLAQAE